MFPANGCAHPPGVIVRNRIAEAQNPDQAEYLPASDRSAVSRFHVHAPAPD